MDAPRKGRFITLEGGEGAGKSAQARTLAARLECLGIDGVLTREPGGSPGAEALRDVILSGEAARFGPAGRGAAVRRGAHRPRRPHRSRRRCARGDWVVCDRFADSTRAYQGAAGQARTRAASRASSGSRSANAGPT